MECFNNVSRNHFTVNEGNFSVAIIFTSADYPAMLDMDHFITAQGQQFRVMGTYQDRTSRLSQILEHIRYLLHMRVIETGRRLIKKKDLRTGGNITLLNIWLYEMPEWEYLLLRHFLIFKIYHSSE